MVIKGFEWTYCFHVSIEQLYDDFYLDTAFQSVFLQITFVTVYKVDLITIPTLRSISCLQPCGNYQTSSQKGNC